MTSLLLSFSSHSCSSYVSLYVYACREHARVGVCRYTICRCAFIYICAFICACGGRVKLWVLIKNCLPFFLSQGLSLGPRAHRLVHCGWPVSPRNLPVSSSSGLSLKPPHLPFCLGARDWIQVFWGLHNKCCTDWYLSSAPHSNVGFVTFCRLYYEKVVTDRPVYLIVL